MANNALFNMMILRDHLSKCIRENDQQVDMDEYIKVFLQINKFTCMVGTLIGLIGSDVETKANILKSYRDGETSMHYETVEKMLTYEKSTGYIYSDVKSNGSRTLLRLHRCLLFVSKFLSKVLEIEEETSVTNICRDAYAQTMGRFHPRLIQQGAELAMMGLLTKKELSAKICTCGLIDANELPGIVQDVVELTSTIFDQCERAYTENDLHKLP